MEWDPTDNIAGVSFEDEGFIEPIDVVILWVDGSDPRQIENLEKWKKLDPECKVGDPSGEIFEAERADISTPNRFREFGELRYSLRAIEKYIPWVRHIHIVTNGQIPRWLNQNHPRVSIVTHEEIYSKETNKFLPTFNSSSIQTQLANIPNLAKKFLLLDDDILLTRRIKYNELYSREKGEYIPISKYTTICSARCAIDFFSFDLCIPECNTEFCLFDAGRCIEPEETRESVLSEFKDRKEYFYPEFQDVYQNMLISSAAAILPKIGYLRNKKSYLAPGHGLAVFDRDVYREMTEEFKEDFFRTASWRFRHPFDLQIHYSYQLYTSGKKKEDVSSDIFDYISGCSPDVLEKARSIYDAKSVSVMNYIVKSDQNNCDMEQVVSLFIDKQTNLVDLRKLISIILPIKNKISLSEILVFRKLVEGELDVPLFVKTASNIPSACFSRQETRTNPYAISTLKRGSLIYMGSGWFFGKSGSHSRSCSDFETFAKEKGFTEEEIDKIRNATGTLDTGDVNPYVDVETVLSSELVINWLARHYCHPDVFKYKPNLVEDTVNYISFSSPDKFGEIQAAIEHQDDYMMLCLNDVMDESISQKDYEDMRAMQKDMYELLQPVPSSFELPEDSPYYLWTDGNNTRVDEIIKPSTEEKNYSYFITLICSIILIVVMTAVNSLRSQHTKNKK